MIWGHLSCDFRICYEVAFILWGLAALLGLAARRSASAAFPLAAGIGSALLLCGAMWAGDFTFTSGAPWFLGIAGFDFAMDPPARWFIAIIGLLGTAAALFSPGYLHHLRKRVPLGLFWAGFSLLLASMSLVVLSANAIVFLFAWEIMAISSFVLVASDHEGESARRAALVYLGATRVGTAFLVGGFLWVYHMTGSWSFSLWHLSGMEAVGPALLIFIGLATKAGCWPFHLWLPIAHPAAPAPVSAIMSGVMLKTAVYAMIRFFVLPCISFPALGVIILVIGGISAFWGVLFALLQHDLKKLLAYHSVENIGIIMMGLGVAVLGRECHILSIYQLGLAAALFHSLNHAVFKSLLFFGAGAIDARTHTRDVEQLGGLIRTMPVTAACFMIGSAAICALPPLNGFASEWLLYKGFFSMAVESADMGLRFSGVLLMGWLAMVGALALACFVKAVGIVFLGMPRSSRAAHAREGTAGMTSAQVLLALICTLLGVMAPLVVALIMPILTGSQGIQAAESLWTLPLQPLTALVLLMVLAVTAWMWISSRTLPIRRYITWECGFGRLGPRTQYTATSFAQPIARMFGAIYHYAVHIDFKGRERRYFREDISVESTYEPYLETKLYAPLLKMVRKAAGYLLMRLQAGSIHQYLLNMVLVFLLLLWLVSRR